MLALSVSWKGPRKVEGEGREVVVLQVDCSLSLYCQAGALEPWVCYRPSVPDVLHVLLPLSRLFSSCLVSPSSCLYMVPTPLCCHGLWVMKEPWQLWGSPSTCLTVPS